jgi:uncharacterized membrane protein YbjE (DUF340 family)
MQGGLTLDGVIVGATLFALGFGRSKVSGVGRGFGWYSTTVTLISNDPYSMYCIHCI